MKYLTIVGLALIFAFVAIFIISAENKNIYALCTGELFASAGIACLAVANKKQKIGIFQS